MVILDKLEVGSILLWEYYKTKWRIDLIDLAAKKISVTYLNEKDRTYDMFYGEQLTSDPLFREAVLYACPRHGFMMEKGDIK